MPDVTSVIHDIGYQRYAGVRLGRRYVVASLYTHGLRTAFGLGRSAKAKIFPWFLVGVVGIVAAVVAAIRAQTGQIVLSYGQLPQTLTMVIIFLCAATAPELVSRDLHTGVLPLYFSRPVRRSDYPLAKLAAMVSALFLTLGGAQLLMFLVAVFTVDGVSDIWGELDDFLKGWAYSAIFAMVFGSVAILVSSLMGRRAIAAGVTVGAFLVTTPVVGVLSVMPNTTVNQLAGLASPISLVSGIGDWLFEPLGESMSGDYGPVYAVVAVALIAGCVALLLARYRKVASA
ncbi:ABC transporter permease subunit [Actinomycetes bacterium KLBMP 9797]